MRTVHGECLDRRPGHVERGLPAFLSTTTAGSARTPRSRATRPSPSGRPRQSSLRPPSGAKTGSVRSLKSITAPQGERKAVWGPAAANFQYSVNAASFGGAPMLGVASGDSSARCAPVRAR
jgi:hypothetical protein